MQRRAKFERLAHSLSRGRGTTQNTSARLFVIHDHKQQVEQALLFTQLNGMTVIGGWGDQSEDQIL